MKEWIVEHAIGIILALLFLCGILVYLLVTWDDSKNESEILIIKPKDEELEAIKKEAAAFRKDIISRAD